MLDPYTTLGVSPTATDAQIKSAYRTLAKLHHPDVNLGKPDAERKFKEVNAAFKLIENAEAREKYKLGQYSESAQAETGRTGPFYQDTQTTGNRYSQAHAEDFQDIFSAFFGQQDRARNVDMPGEDYAFTLEIELPEGVLGVEKQISLQPGKSILLKIPPGTDTGTKLKLKGQGGPGLGRGPAGDAYVEIRLRPSEVFRREGNQVFIQVPVTLGEVVNGAEITIPTLEGPVSLKIPPGMDTTKKLSLKNKGFPDKGGKTRGDLLVTLQVVMPPTQDPAFKEFIREWSQKNPYAPRTPSMTTGGRVS